jgi:hypothetical protein
LQYDVSFSKKTLKNLEKMPDLMVQKFFILAEQLKVKGPLAPNWANYSKLGKNEYHCHLSYSWVACWKHESNTLTIEVYYVGSRQNAPY